MAIQLRLANYITAFQAGLTAIVTPLKVYNTYNSGISTGDKNFVIWFYRNVHQPIYAGSQQANKGIDTPKFDVHVYAPTLISAATTTDKILQAWHGYQGLINNTLDVAKIDITVLGNDYDEELSIHQTALSMVLYVPVPIS